jgi:hypothetical protein
MRLMSCALVEVRTEETPQLSGNAPVGSNVGETPTRTDVAPEVLELVKVKSRIAPATDGLQPQNGGAEEIRIDKGGRTEECDDIVGLAHRPEIGRDQLPKPHHRAVASVTSMPSAMILLLEPIGSDVSEDDNRWHIDAEEARAPRTQLQVVIFRRTDTVLHPSERRGE